LPLIARRAGSPSETALRYDDPTPAASASLIVLQNGFVKAKPLIVNNKKLLMILSHLLTTG
jgi:hypothetical protein